MAIRTKGRMRHKALMAYQHHRLTRTIATRGFIGSGDDELAIGTKGSVPPNWMACQHHRFPRAIGPPTRAVRSME